MRERARRREIVTFLNAGLTQAQIAEKLGISSRTVGRDVARLRPYFSRLEYEAKRKIDEKITARLNETLALMPIAMRFSLVGLMCRADKRLKDACFDALLCGNVAALKRIVLRSQRA